MDDKQTAMQMLVDNIKKHYENLSPQGKLFAYRFFIVDAPLYLSVEKDIIEEAFNTGFKDAGLSFLTGGTYYNKTFKK